MNDLKSVLQARFGDHRVKDYPIKDEDYIDLLKIEVELKFPLRIIATNGLSSYSMPVPERYQGKERVELLFCLPGYWDLEDHDNYNMTWPLEVIQKLTKNVIENETWYGPGHTIANGNPADSISETMKQDYFLLSDPIVLEDLFLPVIVNGEKVHFLAIIPIYHQEFERKQHQGYPKWIKKFRLRNGNEILDDYRKSIYKSRWRR